MSDRDSSYDAGYDAGRESMQEELTRLRAEVEALKDSNAAKADRIDRLGETVVRLSAEVEALRAKYNDLILSVGSKWPGESRHETAKRYIHQVERLSSNQVDAARAALNQEAKP